MTVTPTLSQHKPYQEVFSIKQATLDIQKYGVDPQKRVVELCNRTQPWLQAGSRCPVVDEGELAKIMEKRDRLKPEEFNHYCNPTGFIELNKKGISLAVERRVALFFQQAILCYNLSEFTFSFAAANDQIGSSPKKEFRSTNGSSITSQRQAAHSSTIPTLLARIKKDPKAKNFVFFGAGSSNYEHNATIGMDASVNKADTWMDGKAKEKKLRDAAVVILNEVAQGLDPRKGTEKFIAAFEKQASRCLPSEDRSLPATDPRRLVLERYKHKIGKIRVAAADPVFYDRMLGIFVNCTDEREKRLREVVYKKRYDIIRLREVMENRIENEMENLKQSMKKDACYAELVLLKEFVNTDNQATLEKLFCKTAAVFEDGYHLNELGKEKFNAREKRNLKAFNTRISNLQKKHKDQIEALKTTLEEGFDELRAAENTYKAGMLQSLRKTVNQWTQQELCDAYFEKNNRSISKSWVSRREQLARIPKKTVYKTEISQRRQLLSLEEARRCAKALEVDVGLFLPSLFTS